MIEFLLPELSQIPPLPSVLFPLPVVGGDGLQPPRQHSAQVSLETEAGGKSQPGREGRLPGGPD